MTFAEHAHWAISHFLLLIVILIGLIEIKKPLRKLINKILRVKRDKH